MMNSILFSQAVKDRNVIGVGVTLNKIMRLTVINSDVNFDFKDFSVSLGINNKSSNVVGDSHETKISVASSTRWSLIYGAEEPLLYGINNPQNTLDLNNVGFTIINNGIHNFENGGELVSIPTNNATDVSALQVYPVTLIEDSKAKNGNAGDDTDNLFVIDWRCGTSETGMNSTKLIDQSISPDRYFVNVIFELTSN